MAMDNICALLNEIKTKFPKAELRENEPMSRHCSFRIGGPVRLMVIPKNSEDAAGVLKLLHKNGIKPLIIGNGTNLLVCDEPLERVAVKLGEGLDTVKRVSETKVEAYGGISLARLAQFCAQECLSGLEFAHGIPGSLGGAVSLNAGAYGGEMKDVLVSVKYIDENGEIKEKSGEELELSYRHSVFSDTDNFVLSAVMELQKGVKEEILDKMKILAEKRRNSQPLDKPSGGSTFKRPVGGFAAALLEDAGLKGYSVGGAQVSEKHSGFVINKGEATFKDVMSLMEYVQDVVYEKSGIRLEPELKIIKG